VITSPACSIIWNATDRPRPADDAVPGHDFDTSVPTRPRIWNAPLRLATMEADCTWLMLKIMAPHRSATHGSTARWYCLIPLAPAQVP
jgi:hypothetical protein